MCRLTMWCHKWNQWLVLIYFSVIVFITYKPCVLAVSTNVSSRVFLFTSTGYPTFYPTTNSKPEPISEGVHRISVNKNKLILPEELKRNTIGVSGNSEEQFSLEEYQNLESEISKPKEKYYTKHVAVPLRHRPPNELILPLRNIILRDLTTTSEPTTIPVTTTTEENTTTLPPQRRNNKRQQLSRKDRRNRKKKFTLSKGNLQCFPNRRRKTYVVDKKGQLRPVYYCHPKKRRVKGRRRKKKKKNSLRNKLKKGIIDLDSSKQEGATTSSSNTYKINTYDVITYQQGTTTNTTLNNKLRGSIEQNKNRHKAKPNRRKRKKNKPIYRLKNLRRRKKTRRPSKKNKWRRRNPLLSKKRRKKQRLRKKKHPSGYYISKNGYRTSIGNSSIAPETIPQITNATYYLTNSYEKATTIPIPNESEEHLFSPSSARNKKKRKGLKKSSFISTTPSYKSKVTSTTPRNAKSTLKPLNSTTGRPKLRTTTDFLTLVGTGFQSATTRPIVSISEEPVFAMTSVNNGLNFVTKMGLSLFYSTVALAPWFYAFVAGRRRKKRSIDELMKSDEDIQFKDIVQIIVDVAKIWNGNND